MYGQSGGRTLPILRDLKVRRILGKELHKDMYRMLARYIYFLFFFFFLNTLLLLCRAISFFEQKLTLSNI